VLACPCCGFSPVPQNQVTTRSGELIEMISRSAPAQIDRGIFYRELKHHATERGYKPGWIAHKFKEKFGQWPNGLDDLPPLEPSRTTLGWIRSRTIAWAKSQPGRCAR
jgi:hypothetical protein